MSIENQQEILDKLRLWVLENEGYNPIWYEHWDGHAYQRKPLCTVRELVALLPAEMMWTEAEYEAARNEWIDFQTTIEAAEIKK